MKTAKELLQTYLSEIQNPAAAAALFADDGVLELPTMPARVEGPAAIEKFISGLLATRRARGNEPVRPKNDASVRLAERHGGELVIGPEYVSE